jgi:hypothetical protein
MSRSAPARPIAALTLATAAILVARAVAPAQSWSGTPYCDTYEYLCAENHYNYLDGQRIGHDEPALLFYSSTRGSGNSAIYNLTLPKDPPRLPKQNGTGGTFSFQLNAAFWLGMVMCDTQSFPEFTNTCVPDSDTNIFASPDPDAADYIGKHPGAAYMELQFYPPDWATSYCGTHWCAALNIDSFNFDPNKNLQNNSQCLSSVGRESVNFALVTKNGRTDYPAGPLHIEHFAHDQANVLLMNDNDNITVDMHDTIDGFEVVIYNNSTHQKGSMQASIANGFAQVNFAPNDSTCTTTPYAFHPMYATSALNTVLGWGADTFNVAFSEELGHFDYCSSVDAEGNCTQPGKNEPDDVECIAPNGLRGVKIGGCLADDLDFDGTSYNLNWPGTNPAADAKFHPTPIVFTSPLFSPAAAGTLANYDMTTFEADMPAIESSCNTSTGTGCTNPPAGAAFYPFYSIGIGKTGGCAWQYGGAGITGTTNTFGDVNQYGNLLALNFPLNGVTTSSFEDFRATPQSNPCEAPLPSLTLPTEPITFGKIREGRTSSVKALKIANSTAFPITLFNLALPSDYHLATGKQTTCQNPGVLAPGGKCQYGITLTPSMRGPDDGTATISSNAGNAASTVSLIGSAR